MIAAKTPLNLKIFVRRIRGHPPARRAVQEAELNQIRLVDFFDGIGLLGNGRGNSVQPHRAAAVFFEDRQHDFLIDFVEAEAIHFQQVQRGLRHGLRDAAVGAHLRIVAHAAQQAIGDARRSPAAARQLFGGIVVDLHAAQAGGGAERCTMTVNSSTAYGSSRSTSPKRPRSGALMSPCRVVAPMAVKRGMGSECVRAPGPAPTRMSTRKSSSAEYSISSTSGIRRWISSMKKTWRARMLLRMPVRSSFFCSTGPEVTVMGTCNSSAMMQASVVLPRPGGP